MSKKNQCQDIRAWELIWAARPCPSGKDNAVGRETFLTPYCINYDIRKTDGGYTARMLLCSGGSSSSTIWTASTTQVHRSITTRMPAPQAMGKAY